MLIEHKGQPVESRWRILFGALGWLGLPLYGLSISDLSNCQWNVVNYDVSIIEAPWWPAGVIPYGVPLIVSAWAVRAVGQSGGLRSWRFIRAGLALAPLGVSGLVLLALKHAQVSPGFWVAFFTILASGLCGWCIGRLGEMPDRLDKSRIAGAVLTSSLWLVTGLSVLVHIRLQLNFHEHFMLGHADIGHYAEELKNFIAGRGLRTDSAEGSTLGLHFIPLFLVLVPIYALVPKIQTLMVLAPLFTHLPAILIYGVARRRWGNAPLAALLGFTWLALPTTSRWVYSGTYGFQWLFAALPLLALMLGSWLLGKWRLSILFAILVLLVQETTAPAVLGWGLFVAWMTGRKRLGVTLAASATVYLVLCLYLFIPYFSASGRYEKLAMFGELGGSIPELIKNMIARPDLTWGRLTRPESLYAVGMLLVPLGLMPLRNPKLGMAVWPTLLPVLLLDNPDFLSIKYWEHCTTLPLLFFACLPSLAWLRPAIATPEGKAPDRIRSWPIMVVFLCAVQAHWLFGFSPLSQAYRMYANSPELHRPDPRMAVVRWVRSTVPKSASIGATERLAAHFTDYARLYTGERMMDGEILLIDESDVWATPTAQTPAGAGFQQLDTSHLAQIPESLKVYRHASGGPSAEARRSFFAQGTSPDSMPKQEGD